MLYPSGQGVRNTHAKREVGRRWQLVVRRALPGRAGGLGPCFKANEFAHFYLEISEIAVSVCRAVL